MFPTIFSTLALGTNILSAAGLAIMNLILASSVWVQGSAMVSNVFLIPDSGTTTAPGVFYKDETTPIKTWPSVPGTEHCEGNTGALLCNLTLRLTGSGGGHNYNAGSWVCTTASCSLIRATLMSEASAANDQIYVGSTGSPTTTSGSNIFNYRRSGSGQQIIFTGGLLIPVGSTVKAVYAHANPGAVITAIHFQYLKFWTP